MAIGHFLEYIQGLVCLILDTTVYALKYLISHLKMIFPWSLLPLSAEVLCTIVRFHYICLGPSADWYEFEKIEKIDMNLKREPVG